MGGVGGGNCTGGGSLRVSNVGDAQSGNSVKLVCQTTPNATDGSGHSSPGGRGTLRPVSAAIIWAIGSVLVVHCGGLRRSKVGGPPHRLTTIVLHSGLLSAICGTPLTGGQGRKRSLPTDTPWYRPFHCSRLNTESTAWLTVIDASTRR